MNKTEITIEDVDKQNSMVLVVTDNGEESYKVIAPADIKFARQGKASVSFDDKGNITYLRMSDSGFKRSGFGGNRFGSNTYAKGNYDRPNTDYKQANQTNSFQRGNEVKQYHYEPSPVVLNGVTLLEFKATVEALTKQGVWVKAWNIFQTPITKAKKDPNDKNEPISFLYDVVVLTMTKVDGVREQPEGEF